MAPEVKTELQQKVYAGILDDYQEALARADAKKAQYEAAKKQECIFSQLLSKYRAKLKSNPQDASIKSEYYRTKSLFSNAEIDSSVLLSSVSSLNSYAGKVGQSVFLANSMLS